MIRHQHSQLIYFATANDPYGWLDPSFEHTLEHNGLTFQAPEVLFQWLRFERHPALQEQILRMKTIRGARQKAFEFLESLGLPDKGDTDLRRMRSVLSLLIEQHPDVASRLAATGDRDLVRNAMRSSLGAKKYWGMEFEEENNRWVGENRLGQIWMELRSALPSGTLSSPETTSPRVSADAIPHVHDQVLYFTAVKEPYGWMSNMYPTPIRHAGKMFRTPEALFQWLRFEAHPEVQAEIFAQKGPMGSKMKARVNRDLLRRGEQWDEDESDLDLMRQCLRLKVDQHPAIKRRLLESGDMILMENCSNRDRESARFWGAVYDPVSNLWVGRNVLGKLWMELREALHA
jgi:ribA/ribD-fused uncharacterized protein